MSSTAGRPSRERPRAGIGQPAQAVRLDEICVLYLAAPGDTRVPGDRMTLSEPDREPAAVRLRRDDLELALAVPERPTLVVLPPRTGCPASA